MFIAHLEFLDSVNHLLSAVYSQSVLSLRRVGNNGAHGRKMESVAVDLVVVIVLADDIDECKLVFQDRKGTHGMQSRHRTYASCTPRPFPSQQWNHTLTPKTSLMNKQPPKLY